MLSFDIGEFVYKYYIHPIVYAGEGYNPVNTVTYAIILGISLFAILKLMDILKIKIDEKFVIATAPFILMGASLRVILDVNLPVPPISYWFITPPVYVLAFAITATALLTCYALELRKEGEGHLRPHLRTGLVGIACIWAIISLVIVLIAAVISATLTQLTGPHYWLDVGTVIGFLAVVMLAVAAVSALCSLLLERLGKASDYSRPYFLIGLLSIAVVLALLLTQQIRLWWAPLVIILLASAFTAAIYLIAKQFKLDFLTNKLNIAILAAHMFDASSTFTAIDLVGGWYEEHVVPVFFISIFHTSAVMYLLKLAVFIPVIYVIEKYFKDDPQMYYGIKFVLLVLGAGPGIRNTLHMTFVQT